MMIAPFSWAFRIHLKAIGWFSATLLPSTRMALQCCMSAQWLVIAPRPNEAPRPGTGGAMTNHWVDLQNCKTILVEGSNVAENHPMAFKWIRKAQENGATIIHVDPRYTRTSSAADVYARIRPGTDAAFQNAMINHIIVNKLYDEDYVVTHTNALYLGDEAFDFKDGVFSGYDEEHHSIRHQDLGIPARREGLSAHRQEPRRPALRVHAAEDLRLALHAGDGRADHRHSGRSDQADRRDDGEEPAGHRSSTRSG